VSADRRGLPREVKSLVVTPEGWSWGDRVGQAACDGPGLRAGEQAAVGKV